MEVTIRDGYGEWQELEGYRGSKSDRHTIGNRDITKRVFCYNSKGVTTWWNVIAVDEGSWGPGRPVGIMAFQQVRVLDGVGREIRRQTDVVNREPAEFERVVGRAAAGGLLDRQKRRLGVRPDRAQPALEGGAKIGN